MSRKPLYSTDYMTQTQTLSLKRTLNDFLPILPFPAEQIGALAPTHHLVYFPSIENTSNLLTDGTDSTLSPGVPFVRRLWAGGSMKFENDIMVDRSPFHCTEAVQDVRIIGKEGEEKIWVKVARVIFGGRYPGEIKRAKDPSKKRLAMRICENRTFVFMRENSSRDIPARHDRKNSDLRYLRLPEFSHKIIPTRSLLFRFSALTFNAHAIHFDKSYCREVEGHRNLVVHGPLTIVLMAEVLRKHLQALAESDSSAPGGRPEQITYLEYRNIAPLYADEEMNICVRKKPPDGDDSTSTPWSLWIEGPDGRFAVKGYARTTSAPPVKFKARKPFSYLRRMEEEEGVPEEDVALQYEVNAKPEDGTGIDRVRESLVYADDEGQLNAEEEVEKPDEEKD